MVRCWCRSRGQWGLLCIIVFCLVVALGSVAEAATHTRHKSTKTRSHVHHTSRAVQVPDTSNIYADIVIEADTGRILHETNASAQRHPASLTKMMTLYLAFQAIENRMLRLDSQLPVSAEAAKQSPSKLGLKAGQSISTYDAMMGLVTQSANDAAVVLAEAIGGSIDQFAKMMVDQARTLGMRHTFFRNPNGLPNDEQVTTAHDMAILGQALIYHYPGFYSYFAHEKFTYKGHVYHNHNHLMERYDGMDGIKTGYIRASGFNLVASAVRNNKRLIGVIFGGSSAVSRDRAMAKLLDEAFLSAGKGNAQTSGTVALPSKVPTSLALAGGGKAKASRQTPTSSQIASAPEPSLPESPAEQVPSTEGTSPATGGWGIQVGAFGSIDAAQQYLVSVSRLMAPLVGKAEQSLQKVTMTDGTAVYRTRFMGIDQKTAREACTYMVKHGQSCLVVSGP